MRRHGEAAAAAECGKSARPCATAGDNLLPPGRAGTGARELGFPGAAGRAPDAGVGCSPGRRERVGRRELEARAPRRQSDNSPARENSSPRSPLGAHPAALRRARRRRGIRGGGSRLLFPLGGSSRNQGWALLRLERHGGRPRADSGRGARTRRERACACVCVPARRTVGAPLPAYRNKQPGLLPEAVLACLPLPSDSAAQKANGGDASFKVHINLVLVGYSWQLQNAVPRGVVATAPSEPLLGTSCSG